MELWSKRVECEFLQESLRDLSVEKLFCKLNDGRYLVYYPRDYHAHRITMQSRNSHIGRFTEEFCLRLISSVLPNKDYFTVRNVICEEIGLTKHSGADIAICASNNHQQKAKDILCIIEVKMSLVWNWELQTDGKLEICSDYTKHSAIPG